MLPRADTRPDNRILVELLRLLGPIDLAFGKIYEYFLGFDVPTCSTLYLDKPIRNHTLVQTIARANRVAPGKKARLIVDYVGIFRNLQKALAVYAQPSHPGVLPIKDKAALVEELKTQLGLVRTFCAASGIELDAIIGAPDTFGRLKLIDDAVDALLAVAADKKEYLLLAAVVARSFKAILPDAAANEFAQVSIAVAYVAAKLRALTPSADISDVVDTWKSCSTMLLRRKAIGSGMHCSRSHWLICRGLILARCATSS